MTDEGFETLIRDEIIAIARTADSPEDAADQILAIPKLRDAFAAWWREESYSEIYDG